MDRNTAREAIRTRHRSTRRGRWAFQGLVAIFGLSLLVGGGGGPAGASLAPDLFEITDANITGGSASKPDWGFVFGPGGQVKNAGAVEAQGFLPDPISSDDLASPPCLPGRKGDPTVLAGLASDKNGDPLNGMTWSSGSVPAKNDLTNVYAAGKRDPDTGALFIYFGLDRAETSGSNHVDFEFFKSPVGLQATGTDSNGCPSGTFTGSRTPGDFLISVDFDNGGVVGNPEVRKWDGSKYVVVSNVPASDIGIVQNGAAIACGEWDCRDRDGSVIDTLPQNAFIEGFLNTAAVGFDGCLSTVTAHTRSSPSFTAELKDFAITSFHTCDANIQITPDGVNEIGDPHELTGHVNVRPNTGFVNAPQGTKIDFEIVEGPGTLSAPSCDTVGTTGSCPVVLTSGQPGITKVNATTTVNVGGVILTRETDGTGNNSGPATKRWVDANVQITPSAVNEVGDAHVFTVTATAIPSGATPVSFDIATSVAPAPQTLGSTCDSPTVVGNTATCTVTINSSSTGVFTANATAEVTMGGLTVTRTTDGQAGNSGPATKRYVDASIQITPDGVNALGDAHVFNVTATAIPSGASPVSFAISTTVNPLPDSMVSTCGSPSVSGNTATCKVTINSNAAGTFLANASADVTMGGVTVTRTTDGQGDNSGPATKRYVDARISVTPDGVNEVGDPHTVTGHVQVTDASGALVNAPNGTTIDFDIISGPGSLSPASCDTDGGDGNCSVTLTSNTAGVTEVEATATVNIGGVDLVLVTDGQAGSSAPLVKRWVDASVRITPDGVNPTGQAHVFTVTATAIPSGATPVAFDIATAVSPTPDSQSSTCNNPTVSGNTATCTLTINSDTPGVFTANATAEVTMGGVTVTRTTNSQGANSGPATKEYVDGSISWLKVDDDGDPLGGATFELCRTHTVDDAGTFTDTADACVTVADNTAPDTDTDDGEFTVSNLTLGRYTITETVAPDGYTLDDTVATVEITVAAPEASVEDPWVNTPVEFEAAIQIIKTADPANGPPRDVTYTYLVTNIGPTRLENIDVTDDILGAIGTIPALDPGESATLTSTVAVDENSPVRNVGTACGDPVVGGEIVGPEVCDDDDAVISVVLGSRVVRLPRTGTEARMILLWAAMLIWLGTVLLGAQQRLAVIRRRNGQ